MTIPYYFRKKRLIEAAQCIEEQGCDAVLEVMRIYKPRSHKNTSVPSLKWAYQSIAKLGGFTDTKQKGIASWGRFGKAGILYNPMSWVIEWRRTCWLMVRAYES